MDFNPLRPRGRRPGKPGGGTDGVFISTHSAHEDGDKLTPVICYPTLISTHSAHEDGDLLCVVLLQSFTISTHSAHEDGDFSTQSQLLLIGEFQPTPPTRTETSLSVEEYKEVRISTHSAHEDGDSNTTQKNQQFFITFPQSNHIILPQITANLPCTHPKPFSLCSFSGANPPVNSCLLQVRTKLFETSLPPAARSEYQRLFHFNPFTHPNMFNLCSVFISQVVKSKAVRLLINDICQYGF